MKHLAFATIQELQQRILKKEIQERELVNFFSERFACYDEKLGSSLEIFDTESVLAHTASSGFLAGIPGLIKDNIGQKGRVTSCASRMLQTYIAPYDATVIAHLKKYGAPLLGRANMDEFAMGGSTETSAFKKTSNPWNLSCIPGGSSGGSIAAVAAGLVPWALGTDTGGSVRQPAALCGIVGSKPTYGRISRYGVVAYGSSLDQVGIATRTVYDNALLMQCLAGRDANDATTANVSVPDYAKALTGSVKPGLKIGVIENALYAEGVDPDVVSAIEKAINEYERLGAHIIRITLPCMEYVSAVYYMISRAEAASNLARFDGIRYSSRAKDATTLAEVYQNTRGEFFGAEIKRRILIGNFALSKGYADEYYNSAHTVRKIMYHDVMKAFESVDLMLTPVTPTGAFAFGAFDENRVRMDYLQDYFVALANLTGIPALSIPCGFTKTHVPIGLQLMGPSWSEELLFQTAHAYEQVTSWHTMHPPLFE